MSWFRRKDKTVGCEWLDFCRDCTTTKFGVCAECAHYKTIDRGYGYCVYNPYPIIVGWCRDTCYQYMSIKMVTCETVKEGPNGN